jgi:carboxypeptidase Taq
MTAVAELKEILAEVADVGRAAGLLSWDQETYMPAGGVASRAHQVSTLRRLSHGRFTSAETARLLERAEAETQSLDYDSDDRSLVRVTQRDFGYAVKLPPDLVAEQASAVTTARPVWITARAESDWKIFEPAMQRTVELARRVADAYGYEDSPYDALVGRGEPGLTSADVSRLFDDLKAVIPPLVQRARQAGGLDDKLLYGDFDEARQLAFAERTISRLGFDLDSGRQDLSAHPFCTSFGPGDVRLTTRVSRQHFPQCLFGSIHEAGHGMYNQGLPDRLDRTPLWGGATSGVHESQSRLWENLVGRSRPFTRWLFPLVQAEFGGAFRQASAEDFYRAVNVVQPSYIRVEADEITYNLHILMRCEIERDLIEGRLAVRDVPEAWNAKLSEYLGLSAPPDADGALQDIHWTSPSLAGFVGYTVGNVIGAQLMEAIRIALPELDAELEVGEFAPLLGWLRDNVHTHGRKFTPNELLERVTGSPLSAGPWVAYVRRKYGDLYGLAD